MVEWRCGRRVFRKCRRPVAQGDDAAAEELALIASLSAEPAARVGQLLKDSECRRLSELERLRRGPDARVHRCTGYRIVSVEDLGSGRRVPRVLATKVVRLRSTPSVGLVDRAGDLPRPTITRRRRHSSYPSDP